MTEIQYRPGKDNEAADFLSRSSELHRVDYEGVEDCRYLPPGLKVSCEVAGGGDSMFESILIAMQVEAKLRSSTTREKFQETLRR